MCAFRKKEQKLVLRLNTKRNLFAKQFDCPFNNCYAPAKFVCPIAVCCRYHRSPAAVVPAPSLSRISTMVTDTSPQYRCAVRYAVRYAVRWVSRGCHFAHRSLSLCRDSQSCCRGLRKGYCSLSREGRVSKSRHLRHHPAWTVNEGGGRGGRREI